ncbi:MAG TPA: hypothetical protein VFG10_10205 [Saprospiraceae bacterium]|nr:hypothetical protein [Saprospiraceae bacterium]
MRIPLNQFEEIIDPTILKRGLDYFKKGAVIPEDEDDDGEMTFIVQGSEEYVVRIKLVKDVITDYVCDCPYDQGPVCKHLAAVIFFLQKDELMLNEPQPKVVRLKARKGRPRKIVEEASVDDTRFRPTGREAIFSFGKKVKSDPIRKSKAPSEKTQIDKLLSSLSLDELKDYLADCVLQDKIQKANFLAHFAAKNEYESKETYTRQIKAILKSVSGRHGYVDRREAGRIGKAVHDMMCNAIDQLDAGNHRSAILISTSVLEEMTDALSFIDDSNGDVGGNIETAFDVLVRLSSLPLTEEIRKPLFDFTIEKFSSREFEGWDWHIGMMRLAFNLHRTNEEVDLVMSLLQSFTGSDYDKQEAETISYLLLLNSKQIEAAQTYLRQHLTNPDLREHALQQSFEEGDFAHVKQLAIDGIKADQKTKAGLLSNWYDWLIKTAEAENDKSKVIEYARLQLMDHGREKETYYNIIRQNTAADEWPETYESLINEMWRSRKWDTKELIPNILVAEQDWAKLLFLLEHETKTIGYIFDRLVHFGRHLIPTRKNEIGKLLEEALIRSARSASSRRNYTDLTKDLRQMKKLGYSDIVNHLHESFMKSYRHRPAMIEELRKM